MKPDVIFISITCANDSIAIMQFITQSYVPESWTREATPEAIAEEVAKTLFLPEQMPVKSWRVIDPREIPQDRTFRNAWMDKGKIVVDMPRAREWQKNVLRHYRAEALEDLDVEFTKALESGNDKKRDEVAAERQRLRDITIHPAIEAAQTPEELKQITINTK